MAIDRDLAAPLDPRRVQSREGSGGKKLSYLTTHDVKRTANRIFGYDGWSYYVDELISLGEEPFKNRKGLEGIRVGYRATVTVRIGDVQRGDVGYGDAMEYNGSRITPHELAAKEAVSDALKRCLSSFGDQFGLVLYGADPAPLADEPYVADEGRAPTTERDAIDSAIASTRRSADMTAKQIREETERAGNQRGTIDLREGAVAKLVTPAQIKKMFAVARGYKLGDDEIKSIIKRIADVDHTKEIPRYLMDAILQEIEVYALGQPS